MTENLHLFHFGDETERFCLRTQAKSLPEHSGIYVIVTHFPRRKLGDVVYVGRAINIRSRWATHDKKEYLTRRYKRIYLYVLHPGIPESELNAREKEVTRDLKPRENYLNNAKYHRPVHEDLGKVLEFKPNSRNLDISYLPRTD